MSQTLAILCGGSIESGGHVDDTRLINIISYHSILVWKWDVSDFLDKDITLQTTRNLVVSRSDRLLMVKVILGGFLFARAYLMLL